MAAALRRLLDDALLRRRLGQALQAHVRSSYAAEVVVPQWQALIEEVLAERTAAAAPTLFASTIQGGWESSTHRRRDGRRLDVIAAIGHDRHAEQDYRQLQSLVILTCRDALLWPLIDRGGQLDLSSWAPVLGAARQTGRQVIWDLLHCGWPNDLDIGSPAFVNRFAAGRGFELKVQQARAHLAAQAELRATGPRARFITAEPLIAVHHAQWSGRPLHAAHRWHDAQFQAFDLIAGRLWPQIGGTERALDVVGVNYYWNNQWIHGSLPIDVDDALHRSLPDLLVEVAARYSRPMMLAETGMEGARRAPCFAHILSETARARRRGARIEGVCLYPIANHPGWDNDRMCPNGLFGHDASGGRRSEHAPLADLVRGATLHRPPPG